MKKGINVLSCFDGIAGARLALKKAKIKVNKYYSSEIDINAIKIAQKKFSDIIQLGDINNYKKWKLPKIDLVIGGSPCQSFSIAGKKLNFNDPRGKLFFQFVKVIKKVKPKYFLLENVKMKKEFSDVITKYLKVNPIEINSALVTAQNRIRYYWTNIPGIKQPRDKGILLKDILLDDVEEPMLSNIYGGFKEKKPRVHFDKSVTIRTSAGGGHIPSLIHTKKAIEYMNRKTRDGRTHWDFQHHSDVKNDKSHCVTANLYKGVPYNVLVDRKCIRKLHPIECERLQGISDDYTEGISNTQRYKAIGNCFTIPVISHILKNIK